MGHFNVSVGPQLLAHNPDSSYKYKFATFSVNDKHTWIVENHICIEEIHNEKEDYIIVLL